MQNAGSLVTQRGGVRNRQGGEQGIIITQSSVASNAVRRSVKSYTERRGK